MQASVSTRGAVRASPGPEFERSETLPSAQPTTNERTPRSKAARDLADAARITEARRTARSTLAQLSERERHEQPRRRVREVILTLVALVQEAEVFLGPREVVVRAPPHPVVVGVLDCSVTHHACHGLEGPGETVHRAPTSSRTLRLLRRLLGFRCHEALGYHSLPSRGYLVRKREIARGASP